MDIVQDLVVRWDSVDETEIADPAAWLTTVCARNAIPCPFLLMLERLSPLERAAFLLRDVFDYPCDAVCAVLDRSQATCRQRVSRARRRIRDRPRYDHSLEFAGTLLRRFLAAARDGDVATPGSMLAADAKGNR